MGKGEEMIYETFRDIIAIATLIFAAATYGGLLKSVKILEKQQELHDERIRTLEISKRQ